MKKSYGMSSLPANMIADTTPKPSKNFDHAEHTPKPIHEEIDSEAPRRSKRPRTTKLLPRHLQFLMGMIGKKRSVVR
jgi:hypothetical protein